MLSEPVVVVDAEAVLDPVEDVEAVTPAVVTVVEPETEAMALTGERMSNWGV